MGHGSDHGRANRPVVTVTDGDQVTTSADLDGPAPLPAGDPPSPWYAQRRADDVTYASSCDALCGR
jgi:hypothetical protein